MDVPPGFECRAVTVEPGGDRIYHHAEWADALVLITEGEIELEWRDGRRRRLESGCVLWLAGLELRRIHNHGSEAARLLAISRSAHTAE
jgi:quercetin dioxygenase-like cupin family protein